MHVLLSIPTTLTEKELQSSAQQAKLHIQPITRYILTPIAYEQPTFILGFGGIPIEDIEEAIHALMKAFHYTNSTL